MMKRMSSINSRTKSSLNFARCLETRDDLASGLPVS